MALEPKLAGLVREFDNVVVKRIDIVRGSSDAYRQIKDAYGVQAIPYVRLYGTAGEFLGEADDIGGVRRLIEPQARKR